MKKQRAGATNSNLVLGGILIALGVFFLLGELFDIRLGQWAWPFFVIIPGALMLATGLGLSEDSGVGLTMASPTSSGTCSQR